MKLTFFTLIFLLSAGAAFADPVGEWLVADGKSKVAIAKCGANLCGKVAWSINGDYIGQEVLIDMKPMPEDWTGTILDPRNGTKYLAHIFLQGEQALRVNGCILGGLICGGEVWTRTK